MSPRFQRSDTSVEKVLAGEGAHVRKIANVLLVDAGTQSGELVLADVLHEFEKLVLNMLPFIMMGNANISVTAVTLRQG